VLGSKWRTVTLGSPVADAVITGNDAYLMGVAEPYGWIHGHVRTVFDANRGFDAAEGASLPASLVPGAEPPIHPFLFALDFWRP